MSKKEKVSGTSALLIVTSTLEVEFILNGLSASVNHSMNPKLFALRRLRDKFSLASDATLKSYVTSFLAQIGLEFIRHRSSSALGIS